MKSRDWRVFQTNAETMDINKILRADYLDIIFDGRNKAYGGYELRRKYVARSKRAGMLVIAGAAILSAIPTLASMMGEKSVIPVISERTCELILPPPVHPEVTPPPPPPPGTPEFNPPPTLAIAEPRVTPDRDVTEVLPTIADLDTANVALTTQKGDGDISLITGPGSDRGVPGGTGASSGVATITKPAPEKWVEQMPQFQGNINDWLNAHVRYPETAREQGLEGRSIIEFIVNEDGSIEAAKVARGSFAALDAEALRVVNAMPNWKPGKQNGKPVRVYFTPPVTFHLD